MSLLNSDNMLERSDNMAGNGYTGRLFEEDILRPCKDIPCDGKYIPYRMALDLVRGHQPWKPEDPNTRPANDLHAYICEKAGIEDYSSVKLLTALDTHLDKFHGVDAVAEYEANGRNGGKVIIDITLDLSLNPAKKSHGYKADVIVGGIDDKDLEAAADQVAELLRERAQEARLGIC